MAAFAARGLCADLLRQVLTDHDLVVPERVADEVRRILREKLEVSAEALSAVEAVLERCEILPASEAACPIRVQDPDDERVLADALVGGAEILVTGDHDLLSVAGEAPIPILSPRGFMTLTRGRGPP